MAEGVAFVVITLITIAALQAALGLSLVLVIYGPGAYAAMVAGWYAAHFGAELPWAIAVGFIAALMARALTITILQFLFREAGSVLRCGNSF